MGVDRKRPSAALIVAMVALVAALAGSAVALPGKNAVDKNDIKKNAVKSKAIKNGQVKAVDIADGSVGATELTDPEAVRLVGTAGQPAFENGGDGDCLWSNANATVPDGASLAPVGFYKDPDGRVHLSGSAIKADASGGDGACAGEMDSDTNRDQVIFILPPDYRPAATELFFPNGEGAVGAAVAATDLALGGDVAPAGSVLVNLGDVDLAAVSGISFRAATPAVSRANAGKPAAKASGLSSLVR